MSYALAGLGEVAKPPAQLKCEQDGGWFDTTNGGCTYSTSWKDTPTGVKVTLAVVGVSVLGLIIYGVYKQAQIANTIAEREGSEGLLKYEAGTALIGLAGEAGSRALRQNRRKRNR